jgi:hypothetical protein
MNLRELTQEVNSALDYNPDLAAYKDQVARVVNRHYLQISSQYPWLFMQKLYRITLRKDIASKTTTEDDGSITNNNVLQVGRTDTWDSHWEVRFVGNEESFPTLEMLGNYLIVNDTTVGSNSFIKRNNSLAHGGAGDEYMITGIFNVNTHTTGFEEEAGGRRGTDDKDFPDHMQPNQTSGIVLDRPIMDPSTVEAGGQGVDEKLYYSDWTIEFRRYWLPSDCIEVLGIMDRGLKTTVHRESSNTTTTSQKTAPKHGRIMFLDNLKEEYLFLDRENSGDPVIAVEGESFFVDPPPAGPRLRTLTSSDWTSLGLPSASTIGSRLGFDEGDTLEYCYTFVYAGVESPPSPVTSIKIEKPSIGGSSTGFGITIYGLIDTTGLSKISGLFNDGTNTGMIKRIYRRRVGDKVSPHHQGFERWHHIGDVLGKDGSSHNGSSSGIRGVVVDSGWKTDQTGASEPTTANTPKVLGWPMNEKTRQMYWTYHDSEMHKLNVLDEGGPRQSIRVYRPPSEDMDVEIRYVSRPKRLVADADTPAWPPQYHHVLVYKSLADICLQHGMTTQSQLYERKGEDLLDRMRQKYLDRANRKYIRGGFDRTVYSGERWGTPTKV